MTVFLKANSRIRNVVVLVFVSLTLLNAASILNVRAQSPDAITRIVADSINLDAPVVAMTQQTVAKNGVLQQVWKTPEKAAGWHTDSRLPGQGGNIVISGYSNKYAEVFRHIDQLEPGDTITVYQDNQPFTYTVVKKLFLKEKGESDTVRQENARWLGAINEERLTLVSDWPYANSTHNVIVVAWPISNGRDSTDNVALPATSPTIKLEPDDGPETGQSPPADAPPSLADNPLVAEVEAPNPNDDARTIPADLADAPPITRLVAPSIGLNTAVVDVGLRQVEQDGVVRNVWEVANYAAGWHKTSRKPGQGGNIVFSGHHNINGQVFRYLVDLQEGDLITIYQGDHPSYYTVTDKIIVKEKGEPPEVRRENAKWIGPFNEERVTLVSCWPYTSNTHRLIVVAKPVPAPTAPLALDPFSVEKQTFQPGVNQPSGLGQPAALFPPAFPEIGLPAITRIVAEAINLDAPVVTESWRVVERDDKPTKVWVLPEYAAGWQKDSKLPGQGGNVVLSGYHNAKGEVFRHVVDLKKGDIITLYTGQTQYRYKVADKLILKDEGEPAEVRRQNARWIGQTPAERLTLITGWPYQGNSHRVIVVAHPVTD